MRTELRCPCECNSGGFCGGCGHAGCSAGINLPRRTEAREDGQCHWWDRMGGDQCVRLEGHTGEHQSPWQAIS